MVDWPSVLIVLLFVNDYFLLVYACSLGWCFDLFGDCCGCCVDLEFTYSRSLGIFVLCFDW